MKMIKKFVTVAILTLPLVAHSVFAAEVILADPSTAIEDQYIVVLKEGKNTQNRGIANFVSDESSRLSSLVNVSIIKRFKTAVPGFVVKANKKQLKRLAKDSSVAFIEQDQMVYPAVTWGLDRIDQRNLPLNNYYGYNSTGYGVHAYVIDSGIRTTHSEFTGRLSNGWTAVADGRGSSDCNGHGTHVAGTIGGTTYGVAKDVTLHSVRVFGCTGGAANSTVIDAVDWVADNRIKPAVVNMSLSGNASSALDAAVRGAVNRGVTVVVAAGNDSGYVCLKSPAREPWAITVAASTASDSRLSLSNWGSCVDLFAPGASVVSAWYTSNSATNTMSGTSMAAPHVSGAAALFLEQNPTAAPSMVQNIIKANATFGKISNPMGSPNRLLYADFSDLPVLSCNSNVHVGNVCVNYLNAYNNFDVAIEHVCGIGCGVRTEPVGWTANCPYPNTGGAGSGASPEIAVYCQ